MAEHPDIAAFYELCGYSGGISADDTIFVAVRDSWLVGAVRLCEEQGVVVLRGMQVLARFQRQGIGQSLLDECLPEVNKSFCYCVPFAHLAEFYGANGFERCETGDAPDFLEDRCTNYIEQGHDVLVMGRAPSL